MFNCLIRATEGWLKATLFLLSLSICHSALAESWEIEIKRKKFRTPVLQVKVGDTVVWKNIEYRQYHSVWFEQLGEPEPVDYFYPGETFSRTFTAAGTFPYRCGPHPKMTGVIEVVE